MKYKTLFLVLLIAASVFIFPLSVSIRSYDHQNFTRVVLEGSQGFEYKFTTSKTTIKIKLHQKVETKNNIGVLRSEMVDRVTHYYENGCSVFQVHIKPDCKIQRNFVLEKPFRVVFDVVKSPAKAAEEKTTAVPQEIKKPDPQEQEVKPKENLPPTETEGKKELEAIRTICLDPGHGGTDFGAVGRSNLMEKDITLNIAKRLKKQIESKLGLDVVMTREGDEEVSLNSRVAKANNHKAQIFVSIHVNSSFRKAANGPETYYVSLNATDQEAFQLSQKENSSPEEEIDKLAQDDQLKMILWDMAQNEYIKESSKLADFIQFELNVLMHTRNRGVKQAPFRVLMRAAMAAVLVEVSFISNPSEENQLKDEEFLDKMTAALYSGIAKYIYNYSSLVR